MKKVVFIINYIVNGGPSRVIYNIAINLVKKFDVTLITLFDKNNKDVIEKFKKKGIKVKELNVPKNFRNLIIIDNIVSKELEKIKPDIVHTHGILPDYINMKLKLDVKKVSTLHCNVYEDYILTYGKLKGNIYAQLHIFILKHIHNVVACSKYLSDCLKNKIPNITFIRNGISENLVNKNITRKDLKIPDDALIYVYVGNFTKGKNILNLLRWFKQCNSNNYLLVLGKGPLEYEVKKYESERIKILGFKENIMEYFNLADIYVSASLSEGFSISVLEALDTGLHLLLSNIPSHNEVININKDIYLGEVFDNNNFKSQIKKLEDKFRKENKSEIISFKNRYLSDINMTNEYIKVYEEE